MIVEMYFEQHNSKSIVKWKLLWTRRMIELMNTKIVTNKFFPRQWTWEELVKITIYKWLYSDNSFLVPLTKVIISLSSHL